MIPGKSTFWLARAVRLPLGVLGVPAVWESGLSPRWRRAASFECALGSEMPTMGLGVLVSGSAQLPAVQTGVTPGGERTMAWPWPADGAERED